MWLIVSSLSPHDLHLLLFAYYWFSLWYYWSLWRYSELLLEDIQFLSWGFPFLAVSRSSCVWFCQFVIYYIILIAVLFFASFSHKCKLVIFHMESEWQQVSSDLQDSSQYFSRSQQCWIVTILLLISNASSFFSKPFRTVPSAPTTIGITITRIFHRLFSSLARSRYLSLFLFSFILTLWPVGTAVSTRQQVIVIIIIANFLHHLNWWSFIGVWVIVSLLISPELLLLLLFFFFFSLLLLLLLFYFFESFSHRCQLMVFHWSLSDSKSPQVYRTYHSILVDLNNAVVWRVSNCPLICKSSCSFIHPLGIVPRIPIAKYSWHSSHKELTCFTSK